MSRGHLVAPLLPSGKGSTSPALLLGSGSHPGIPDGSCLVARSLSVGRRGARFAAVERAYRCLRVPMEMGEDRARTRRETLRRLGEDPRTLVGNNPHGVPAEGGGCLLGPMALPRKVRIPILGP